MRRVPFHFLYESNLPGVPALSSFQSPANARAVLRGERVPTVHTFAVLFFWRFRYLWLLA